MLEESFKIVNTVRSRHNRTQRAQAPTHARLKQQLNAGEHRVMRGRPLIMTTSQIESNLEEILAKASQGLIQVQTMDGRPIDLEILRVRPPVEADAPPPVVVPVVNKPLDSAARDKQGIGENIPSLPGGIPLAQVTAGNTTTGGIPGPLENEKNKTSSVGPAAGGDPAGDESDDPAGDEG